MSNQQNGPRDVVEGGPERAPDGGDQPEKASGRPHKDDEQKKDAPPRQGDVPPWYQPESGQPGTSR
ncbi:MAG: hypothetical protein ACJ8F1_08700 [Polyangia bacterium]